MSDHKAAGAAKRQATSVADAYAEWRETAEGWIVYNEALRIAKDLKRQGWETFGMKAIWERIRFDRKVALGPKEGVGWKLDNNFTSRMARELMESAPILAGFFETRELSTGFEPEFSAPEVGEKTVDPGDDGSTTTVALCRACAGQAAEHMKGCPKGRGDQGSLFDSTRKAGYGSD